MSDSLNATVIVILPVSTISAKPEPLDDDEPELDEPALVAVPDAPEPVSSDPVPDPPEPAELDPEPDPEVDPPPEIWSPGLVLSSDTTVPVAGAYSRVSARAVFAFCRFSWALSTAACAEAIAAGDGEEVVVVVLFGVELVGAAPPPADPRPPDDGADWLASDTPAPDDAAGPLAAGL